MKTKDKNQNYLEFVPVRNPDYPWIVKDDGKVVVTISHKGFYDKIAQKFFKKPAQSEITLDEFGSFIWQQIDGQRNVFQIAQLVEQQFGERANPLYERLIKFIEILKDNKFATVKEVSSHA